jgi:hypothetical protein
MRSTKRLLTIIVTIVLLSSICATVYATTTVYVYVKNPNDGGVKGQWCSNYWLGEIPIRVANTQSGAPTGEQTTAYCMNPSGVIYVGQTYQASVTPVIDNATWKAISYILTWYSPATNADAMRNQVAIWKLLGQTVESWVPGSAVTAGTNLKNEATGKDVIRQTDTLIWTSPSGLVNQSAVTANPGQSIYFEIKLMNGANPRPNVNITFTASAGLTPTNVLTDSQGKAGVTVTVPSNWPQGSSITVKAETRGVWPRLYLDLTQCGTQDLIGIDTTYDLTVEAHACLIAHINMVPEVELGTLVAVSAMALGFVGWTKTKNKNKA